MVTAKQIGGRSLGADPHLWKTLFPSSNPTIDGRVPVDQSAKYLVQSRLASSKELIAVTLSPTSPEDVQSHEMMFDFLVGKK
jgi:hypothetical protein